MARRIKEGNEKETDPASNQFSEIHRVGREEKGEGRDRDNLVEKKESPKEEKVVKPVISLSGKIGY